MEYAQKEKTYQPEGKYVQGGHVVLRQEFDDWGILFDADSGEGYAVDPVAVFIWQQFDGSKTVADIIGLVKENFAEVPDDATLVADGEKFINQLVEQGLIGVNL